MLKMYIFDEVFSYATPSRMGIRVDKNKAFPLKYASSPRGHTAGISDHELLKQLKAGHKAKVRLCFFGGWCAIQEFSLKGFTKTYHDLPLNQALYDLLKKENKKRDKGLRKKNQVKIGI